MSEYKNTQEKYSENGVYHSDRQETHQEIIGYFFKEEVNPIKPPEAVLLGGGSAVGKSTIRDFYLLDYQDREIPIIVIDSDEIKTKIPEYQEKLSEEVESAAKYVHDESSDVSLNLLKYCMEENKNFVFDGTMKTLSKYEKIIEEAKAKGYKITIVVVDVPLEVAKQWAHVRYLKTGRLVPPEALEESHRKVPAVFQALKDTVDEYLLIDMLGNGEDPFEYVATKVNGDEEIHNPVKYRKFLQKSGIQF